MYLIELFTKPAPVQRVRRNMLGFEVGNDQYYVEFQRTAVPSDLIDPNDRDHEVRSGVDVSFFRMEGDHRQYMITDTARSKVFTIFSTVMAAIGDWVSRNDVTYVVFSADEGEQSRMQLYQRILKTFNIKSYQVPDPDDKSTQFVVPVEQFK